LPSESAIAAESTASTVSRSKTTLLFAAKDRELNEAVVLAEVLETGF
jgi:uncharacterized protein YeaO (DUF488 family)